MSYSAFGNYVSGIVLFPLNCLRWLISCPPGGAPVPKLRLFWCVCEGTSGERASEWAVCVLPWGWASLSPPRASSQETCVRTCPVQPALWGSPANTRRGCQSAGGLPVTGIRFSLTQLPWHTQLQTVPSPGKQTSVGSQGPHQTSGAKHQTSSMKPASKVTAAGATWGRGSRLGGWVWRGVRASSPIHRVLDHPDRAPTLNFDKHLG